MNGDPQYTIVTVFHPDGSSAIIEIEDTPLETDLNATFDGGKPVTVSLGVLLFVAANLFPESSTKYHAWKAYQTLNRERVQLEDRIAAPPKDDQSELPF